MHRAAPSVIVPDRGLVDALLHADAFDHDVGSPQLIETHISWVILAGAFAYKIKKPLTLGFLDFRKLSQRKFFCEEEIRLNQPTAPDIYVDVVPVTDGPQPRFGGDGRPVEYAVRMHRFDDDNRLDRQLALGRLSADDMRELGEVIARRHDASARVAAGRRDHQLAMTQEFIWENFRWLEGAIDTELLTLLRDWTQSELERVDRLLGSRFDAGFVRECHGDLHLANLVRMPGGIRTFDCIEFSADLRNSDVVCDTAFLVMDLVARERHDLAARFLNRYLECTGDYAGIALLDLYFVYRCLVRAKVAAIGRRECADDDERQRLLDEALRYCTMAKRQALKPKPVLVVMHGVSGSGKTWIADALLAALPAIRIRSDVERKRLFGLGETATTGSGWGQGIYSPEADEQVYGRLCKLAATLLDAGHNVILDAAFLKKAERDAALLAARRAGCPAVVVDVQAAAAVLRERLAARAREARDASEADAAVLERQLAERDPLGSGDDAAIVVCANNNGVDIAAIAASIREYRQAGSA